MHAVDGSVTKSNLRMLNLPATGGEGRQGVVLLGVVSLKVLLTTESKHVLRHERDWTPTGVVWGHAKVPVAPGRLALAGWVPPSFSCTQNGAAPQAAGTGRAEKQRGHDRRGIKGGAVAAAVGERQTWDGGSEAKGRLLRRPSVSAPMIVWKEDGHGTSSVFAKLLTICIQSIMILKLRARRNECRTVTHHGATQVPNAGPRWLLTRCKRAMSANFCGGYVTHGRSISRMKAVKKVAMSRASRASPLSSGPPSPAAPEPKRHKQYLNIFERKLFIGRRERVSSESLVVGAPAANHAFTTVVR